MKVDLVNTIGKRMLSFQNSRVVAPPGVIVANGRQNVIVATPKRSGTHLAIDMIVNNHRAYRRKPVYVDLDMVAKRRDYESLDRLRERAGYVIKTHFPIAVHNENEVREAIDAIASGSVVIVIHRSADDIVRSMGRWSAANDESVRLNIERFQEFWRERADVTLDFASLFKPEGVRALLAHVPGGTPKCVFGSTGRLGPKPGYMSTRRLRDCLDATHHASTRPSIH
jgi:hypothetical protein